MPAPCTTHLLLRLRWIRGLCERSGFRVTWLSARASREAGWSRNEKAGAQVPCPSGPRPKLTARDSTISFWTRFAVPERSCGARLPVDLIWLGRPACVATEVSRPRRCLPRGVELGFPVTEELGDMRSFPRHKESNQTTAVVAIGEALLFQQGHGCRAIADRPQPPLHRPEIREEFCQGRIIVIPKQFQRISQALSRQPEVV